MAGCLLYTSTMAMQVIYEKDTINHWKTVTEPGVQQIRLFADTLEMCIRDRLMVVYAT